ncbi:beta-hydroxyaspartate dehydratase BhcB [Aquibium microcysteis]|uniref:beta-hydroxyaspartate dehydratase BhcB n=1 Tax=Aquibium microcysteis TaxID=675281 RepID=UPI00165CF183|nr:beta-hydroxyaspartate dehydratase BhcB [Aquibium microcysteis]
MQLPNYDDVVAAHERIRPHVHRTPVLTSSHLDALAGARLLLKCENLQKIGAFKARGACNAVFGLSQEQAGRGVLTHSSGNHGQALAYAAAKRGIPATIVMPETSARPKLDAVRGYGGRVVTCAPGTKAREEAVAAELERTGAEIVHPYADARVIAGQGTCARELIEEAGPFDAIVAPVGGGGLISGTCVAAHAMAPGIKVFAAEPANADDAFRSKAAGHLVEDDAPQTIADGLRASLKPITFHYVRNDVEAVLTVSEAEIVAAMRLVWERLKIVIEPSSAVAIAAVLKNAERFAGQTVGIIVTGGNVDLDRLPWMA